jgi:hypothetical protein
MKGASSSISIGFPARRLELGRRSGGQWYQALGGPGSC